MKKQRYLPYLIILIALSLGFCGCGEDESKKDPKEVGLLALESSDFMKAVGIFKSALQDKPSDRDLLYYVGVSYKRMDMFDSALVYLKRGRLLYTRDREINQELVDLCPMFSDYSGAIDAIAVLIATGDNEKMYWKNLAELYWRNKNNTMAIKYYKLLVSENPDNPRTQLMIATLLTEESDHEQSNDYLQQMLTKFGPSPEVYANLGINYLSLKKFEKAEESFRSSLALRPDNIPIWINLANVLTIGDDRAKKNEALEIYKKYQPQTPIFYNLDSIIPALEEELQG